MLNKLRYASGVHHPARRVYCASKQLTYKGQHRVPFILTQNTDISQASTHTSNWQQNMVAARVSVDLQATGWFNAI